MLTALTTSQRDAFENVVITALVRKQEQIDALQKIGVSGRLFNGLEDTAQLESEAKDHDGKI